MTIAALFVGALVIFFIIGSYKKEKKSKESQNNIDMDQFEDTSSELEDALRKAGRHSITIGTSTPGVITKDEFKLHSYTDILTTYGTEEIDHIRALDNTPRSTEDWNRIGIDSRSMEYDLEHGYYSISLTPSDYANDNLIHHYQQEQDFLDGKKGVNDYPIIGHLRRDLKEIMKEYNYSPKTLNINWFRSKFNKCSGQKLDYLCQVAYNRSDFEELFGIHHDEMPDVKQAFSNYDNYYRRILLNRSEELLLKIASLKTEKGKRSNIESFLDLIRTEDQVLEEVKLSEEEYEGIRETLLKKSGLN